MKERPILFSASMIRALLVGRKTQTRRAVKLPHQNPLGIWEPFDWGGPNGGRDKQGNTVPAQQTIAHSRTGENIGCPHGQPGDHLWVRESFSPYEHREGCWYWADGNIAAHDCTKPKPSIHMHRWFSRITLEITSVRVERLQDISEADAIAESAPGYEEGVDEPPPSDEYTWSYRTSYQRLWESINGKGSWDANPWVWVIEFKRIAQ